MRFLNINVDNITFEEALQKIEQLVNEGNGGYVVTPNVDHIVQLEKNAKLQKAYQHASLVLTDGQPLIWISKWLHKPIKEKISGADLFPRLCELAARKSYRVYFLGAAPGVAELAAKKLGEKYPGLNVVETFSPEYGFEKDSERVKEICDRIHAASPDILIVGLGAPKQEVFMDENRKRLGHAVALGLGGSIDFEAGKTKRAPLWMQNCGLEWFYRLCKEPRRLFKRYFLDAMKIIPIVWKYRKF